MIRLFIFEKDLLCIHVRARKSNGLFQIWYDVANALVKDNVQFRLSDDSSVWEEKCLAFSSQQIHIQLDEVQSNFYNI